MSLRNFSYETPKNYIKLLCKSAGLLVASMMTLTCAVEFVKYLNFSWERNQDQNYE